MIAAARAARGHRHLPAHRARRESAGDRGRAGAARAASCRRRLRALGAERAQRDRDRRSGRARSAPWAASSISAPTGMGPGEILYGNRGAVVVGEIDGAPRERTRAMHALLDAVRARRRADRQHLGLSVGQARLRGDAVRDRAERRLDVGELRRPAALRVFDALGREVIAVAKARGDHAGRLQGVRSGRLSRPAPARRARAPRSRRSPNTPATAPRRIPASGAISRCASARPRSIRRSASSARSAREAGIATPAIDRLVALIHDIEDGRRADVVRDIPGLIDTCTSATTAASRS